ncbi:unnamed protein product [Meganyctiphanes norvegica]|uniref:G-protein coupled receptors family 1 profile domain-containing protein n=1 Tax=Meganyctiphanes norvegica TaxID=48144 RepID=A0AAV2S2C3_MEGNR
MFNCSDLSQQLTVALQYSIVHMYCLALLATFANGCAIWCVIKCRRTQTGMKFLLVSVFLPLLLYSLLILPGRAELHRSVLICDYTWVPQIIAIAIINLDTALVRVELYCIALVALYRLLSVSAPQRSQQLMNIKVVIPLMIFMWILCFLPAVALPDGVLGNGTYNRIAMSVQVGDKATAGMIIIYHFMSFMLPAAFTIICYALMICTMKRRQLQSKTKSTVAEQVTRAVTCVFFSNFLFSFPHSLFHLMVPEDPFPHVIMHLCFWTILFVDPVLFVMLNRKYKTFLKKNLCCCLLSEDEKSYSSTKGTSSFAMDKLSNQVN